MGNPNSNAMAVRKYIVDDSHRKTSNEHQQDDTKIDKYRI